jgi:hypothetical protein
MWFQEILKAFAGCDEATLQKEINRLNNELGNKTKEFNVLQGRYLKETSEKDLLLETIKKENWEKVQGYTNQVASLEGDIKHLENEKKILEVQLKKLKETSTSIFNKPKPALLDETDPKRVMLADFVIRTSKGSMELRYPHHTAIFSPSPIFEEILNEAGVNSPNTLTPIQICNRIANVFHNRIKYTFDADQWFGRMDNWTPASLVKLLGQEDCESSAMAILSAIFYYQVKYGAFKDYSCLLGLGYFKQGDSMFGHGFVIIMHDTSKDLNHSYIIEPTLEFESNAKTIQQVRTNYTCDWGIIGFQRSDYADGTYFVNQDHRWWLETGGKVDESFLGKIKKKLLNEDKKEFEKKKREIENVWSDNQ